MDNLASMRAPSVTAGRLLNNNMNPANHVSDTYQHQDQFPLPSLSLLTLSYFRMNARHICDGITRGFNTSIFSYIGWRWIRPHETGDTVSYLWSQNLIAFWLVKVWGCQEVTEEVPLVLASVVVTRASLAEISVPLNIWHQYDILRHVLKIITLS